MTNIVNCVLCDEEITENHNFTDTMIYGHIEYFHDSCGYGVINDHIYATIKEKNKT